MTLTRNDKSQWLETIWEAIHALEDCQPETDMDDVKTAMAWVTESLGLELDDNGDYAAIDTNESALEQMDKALKAQGFQFETGGGGCQLLSRYMESGAFVWATCLDGGGLPDTSNWTICAYGDDIDEILFELRSDQNESGLSLEQAAEQALRIAREFESAGLLCRNGKPIADCTCC